MRWVPLPTTGTVHHRCHRCVLHLSPPSIVALTSGFAPLNASEPTFGSVRFANASSGPLLPAAFAALRVPHMRYRRSRRFVDAVLRTRVLGQCLKHLVIGRELLYSCGHY